MIKSDEIIKIGSFLKPHGIKGELTASLDYDVELAELSCIIVDVDGIFVPFFLNSVRPKSSETVIVGVDGIENENEAKSQLAGKDYFALKKDVDIDETVDQLGGYLADFIGFTLTDENGTLLGDIVDFDDATENILFILQTPSGVRRFVPVADELIIAIDPEKRSIKMNLPAGLMDL